MHKKYLLFSMISGVFELGVLVVSYRKGGGIFEILLVALAYQMGNISLNIIGSYKKSTYFIGLLLLLSILTQSLPFIVFASSFNIQLLRDVYKTNVTTLQKRVFRIIGFFFAAMLTLYVLYGLVIGIYFFSIIKNTSFQKKINKKNISLRLIMLFHQMHYFFYCYVFIYILMLRFGYHRWYYIGITFTLGWLSYIMSQKVWRSMYSNVLLGISHLMLAVVLSLMFFMKDYFIALLFLWLLTGIFGGTVYIISHYYQKYNMSEKLHQDENMGHVLGVLGALLVISIGVVPEITFLISSLLAILVSIMSLINYSAWEAIK